MSNSTVRVLVIIPAYNEENSILSVVKSIENVTNQSRYCIDYVVVNDGSTDGTVAVCDGNKLCYLSLPVNLGIGGAVQLGYKYAFAQNYDIAIQIDGDGQHDATYIDDLIKPIIYENYDMVIGSRYIERKGFQSSFMRRVGINFLSRLIYIRCGILVKDVTSGFRAVNKDILSIFSQKYPLDYPEPDSLASVSRSGFKVKEVPVIMKEREHGKSSINHIKSIYYMIKVSIAIILCEKYEV